MTDTALQLEKEPAPLRLWGGRFAAEPSVDMDRLNRSLPVDHRLWREDVAGGQAWASALPAGGGVTHAQGGGARPRPARGPARRPRSRRLAPGGGGRGAVGGRARRRHPLTGGAAALRGGG